MEGKIAEGIGSPLAPCHFVFDKGCDYWGFCSSLNLSVSFSLSRRTVSIPWTSCIPITLELANAGSCLFQIKYSESLGVGPGNSALTSSPVWLLQWSLRTLPMTLFRDNDGYQNLGRRQSLLGNISGALNSMTVHTFGSWHPLFYTV